METLPHSTDIFNGEDWIGSKKQKEVSDRMDVESCIQDILDEVEEVIFCELCSEQYDPERHGLWRRIADSGERLTGTCSHCLSDYYMIEQRCADTYEVPPDYLSVSWGGELLCQSCQCDGKKCECCGISEKLVKTQCDRNANFSLIEGTFPQQYLCDECKDYEEDDIQLISEVNEVLETYVGEFEIDTEGDDSLLNEDNEETTTTKNMMKEVMDEMFMISDNISENTYMKIVNKMKEVYERL